MAHDGQSTMTESPVLDDLLKLTGDTIAPVEAILNSAKKRVSEQVCVESRVSASALESHQTAAHGLAWLATYVESLRQMQNWATRLNSEANSVK